MIPGTTKGDTVLALGASIFAVSAFCFLAVFVPLMMWLENQSLDWKVPLWIAFCGVTIMIFIGYTYLYWKDLKGLRSGVQVDATGVRAYGFRFEWRNVRMLFIASEDPRIILVLRDVNEKPFGKQILRGDVSDVPQLLESARAQGVDIIQDPTVDDARMKLASLGIQV